MTRPGERDSTERRDEDVTASEVAAYAYCAKAWHLEQVLRTAASADATRRRADGVERHAEHGARVARLRAAGPVLVWGAVVLLTLALLLAGLAFVVSW